MRLTRASSYALHAVLWMAAQKTNAPAASHLIAKERNIPERFLLKVLHPLVKARILLSIKGPNGGYRLIRPASKINLLEIIEAVDGPIEAKPSGFDSGVASLDRAVQRIADEAALAFSQPWKRTTIDRLMGAKK